MILSRSGQIVSLGLVLADGAINRFPQARIFDAIGTPTPLAVLNMAHIADGFYRVGYIVPTDDLFHVHFTVYDDVAHTTVSNRYARADEIIQANLPEDPPTLLSSLAEAQLNVAYDEDSQIFRAAAWMDRGGTSVLAPTTAVLNVWSQAHVLLFTQSSNTPTNGVFIFQRSNSTFLDNQVVYVEVTVTDSLGTVRTIQSLSTVA